MMQNEDENKKLEDSQSIHTLEDQKELVDHIMKGAGRNIVKMLLIIFPIVILTIIILLGALFYFLGVL